jgi:hypothetical protein
LPLEKRRCTYDGLKVCLSNPLRERAFLAADAQSPLAELEKSYLQFDW